MYVQQNMLLCLNKSLPLKSGEHFCPFKNLNAKVWIALIVFYTASTNDTKKNQWPWE